ncbi:hypothetical protein NDU88_001352 [Pleurodeles waltl]|uniref:Uncharacterized protein n=1 Tax=Pleurodeles waltl TaxID=8319 RepID=A0AAV7U7B8_PLEWA|nr:hypothetical protein NDU88_001352 [Pleurodeles waltl]
MNVCSRHCCWYRKRRKELWRRFGSVHPCAVVVDERSRCGARSGRVLPFYLGSGTFLCEVGAATNTPNCHWTKSRVRWGAISRALGWEMGLKWNKLLPRLPKLAVQGVCQYVQLLHVGENDLVEQTGLNLMKGMKKDLEEILRRWRGATWCSQVFCHSRFGVGLKRQTPLSGRGGN